MILLLVIPLMMRYMISEAKQELRRDFNQAIDSKIKDFGEVIDAKNSDLREYIRARFDAQDARLDAQDAKFKDLREHMDARFNAQDARFDKQDARIDQLDRKNDSRAYDMTLHLIDVRERLANIEGRLGIATPRMSAVSPPVEEPVEVPRAPS